MLASLSIRPRPFVLLILILCLLAAPAVFGAAKAAQHWLALTLALEAPSHADRYVSPAGNDADPGTEQQPWRTIQKAADTLMPGQTVYIRQGTYPEMVVPARSGAADNYITYRSYPGESVVIDAQGIRDYAIFFSGKSYLQFVGLRIANARAHDWSAGLRGEDGSDHVIVDRVEAYGNSLGLCFDGHDSPVSHLTIKGSYTHDNQNHGIFLDRMIYDSTIGPNNHSAYNQWHGEGYSPAAIPSTANPQVYGLDISTPDTDPQSLGARRIVVFGSEFDHNLTQGLRTWNVVGIWIHDNNVQDNGATGIQIENGTEQCVVENNSSTDNAQVFEYETGVWVAGNVFDCVIRGNRLTRNKMGFMASNSVNRVIFHNNVVYINNRGFKDGVPNTDSARGIQIGSSSAFSQSEGPFQEDDVMIAHNTLYGNGTPDSYAALFIRDTTRHVVLRNNIVAASGSNQDLEVEANTLYSADYNLWYNIRPFSAIWHGNALDWVGYNHASGQEAHSLISDPRFISVGAADFRLQADSPARDAGDWLTRTVGGGIGMTVTVRDARWWSDGYQIAPGDRIAVGTNPEAGVTRVDYLTNRISVDRVLIWADGDPVSYPYSGAKPDIGDYEFGAPALSATSTPR